MPELLAIWFVLCAVLVVFALGRPGEGGALTLAYAAGLSLIHAPGALAFLSPEIMLPDADETRIGFQLTLLGLAAFVAGAVLARLGAGRVVAAPDPWPEVAPLRRASSLAIAAGAAAYFMLLPLSRGAPSATSLVAPLGALLVVGIWLRLTWAHRTRRAGEAAGGLALLPLLPLATLATGGFIGYGVSWVISVAAFMYAQSRRRWAYLAAAPAVVFLGLSVFVTYAAARSDIREAVWGDRASYGERFGRIGRIVADFRPLDLHDAQQMESLDARLNQNAFVGRGVERHESGFAPLEHGATVAPWALVPRFLWPDKPDVAGSAHLVADFVGVQLAEGASFGVGQVLEFYMNFGVPGVALGFFGLGFLLRGLDSGIARALAAGDFSGLLSCALPGIMMLQPGGSLMEILVASVAALLVAQVLSGRLPWIGLAPAPGPRSEARRARQVIAET